MDQIKLSPHQIKYNEYHKNGDFRLRSKSSLYRLFLRTSTARTNSSIYMGRLLSKPPSKSGNMDSAINNEIVDRLVL